MKLDPDKIWVVYNENSLSYFSIFDNEEEAEKVCFNLKDKFTYALLDDYLNDYEEYFREEERKDVISRLDDFR